MGMGIVSDKEFESEKSNCLITETIKPKVEIVNIVKPGRKLGDNNVPESLRKLIGETSITEGRDSATKLAHDFGISPSSVSAYTNGATSTTSYDKPDDSLVNHMKNVRAKLSKRATHKLHKALNHITDDKFEGAKLRDVASVARDLSVIIKNMDPPVESNKENERSSSPTFVFYAPQPIKEESFETIYSKD